MRVIISRKRKGIWTEHFFIFCNLAIDSENLLLKNSWREIKIIKCLENWNVEICDGIRDSWIKCLKWSDQSNLSIFELKVCLSANFAQIKHFYIFQISSKSKDKDTKIHSAAESFFRKFIAWDFVLLVFIVILSAKSWIFWHMSF